MLPERLYVRAAWPIIPEMEWQDSRSHLRGVYDLHMILFIFVMSWP